MIGDIGAKFYQARDQQRRGGLPIHIEITPDTDALAGADGLFDPVGGCIHPRPVQRGGRFESSRVQEGLGGFNTGQATLIQNFGHQRVPANKRP